ncbi:MAG: hypothetical protein FIA82_10005 [Melioribacter sp.]|nr:hypothetical protein [Melioribacter sp.]
MLYQNRFRKETVRLKEWDYSNPWWYYITISTKNHCPFFGEVVHGNMILNKLGIVTEKCWDEIPKHYHNVGTDYYVVMPNHIHGIIIINESRDVACNVSTNKYSQISPKKNSLSAIVRSYKSAVTKFAHENGFTDFISGNLLNLCHQRSIIFN